MADSKLNNTELIRYKAISGRMFDYFLDLNCVMTDWQYSLFCWKTFSVWFATNHLHIMDRTPREN